MGDYHSVVCLDECDSWYCDCPCHDDETPPDEPKED